MKNTDGFPAIFETLSVIWKPREPRLDVVTDGPKGYYLNTRVTDKKGRPVFFGAVKMNKNYVSFYLMPVYMFPDLLDGLSPTLK